MALLESWFATLVGDPTQEVYSVKDHQTQMLGWVHLHNIDLRNGTATVGVVVDPEFWGQGVGYQAMAALCIHAFDDLRLVRLEAEILAMNHPSKKLFHKIGFVHEGTRRQGFFTAGRRLDVEVYGLLAQGFVWPRHPTQE